MFKFGIITDEVYNKDFEAAVIFGVEHGIKNFELRNAYNNRAPFFDKEQKLQIKRIVSEYKIEISALSPGTFKTSLYDDDISFHAGEMLTESLNFAEEFGINKLITFGVKRHINDTPEDFDRVINYLGEAAYNAKKRGIVFCVENEPGWWADTSKNVYKLLKGLSSVDLKLNWDPGNLFVSGELDYKPGYELLKNYIVNVHIKDAIITQSGTKYVPVGEGEIKWADQISDLVLDGYTNNVSLETHCEPRMTSSDLSIKFINDVIAKNM